jgi:hypothetical protein
MHTLSAANDLVPATHLARELAITRRTLARWRDDPKLEFPQPIIINERWFFRRADIAAWQTLQANKPSPVRPRGKLVCPASNGGQDGQR